MSTAAALPVPDRQTAVRSVLRAQLWMMPVWLLFFGVTSCGCESLVVILWLPLNYLLFDLYLLIRGRRGRRWQDASRRVRVFIRYSPLMMVPSALILGIGGSGIHGALRS